MKDDNLPPDNETVEEWTYENDIHGTAYAFHKNNDFEFKVAMTNPESLASQLNELTRLRSELQQAKQEIANHLAVNSLLTDSDGEADLANKLYKATSELQQKDEVITALKNAMIHGSELYAHLRVDDEPFTPYQLALQEIESLKAKLNN